MAIYKFDFAMDNRQRFDTCVFPLSGIPVWYLEHECCFADFIGQEVMELDLPQDAIDHLQNGTATIIPLTFPLHPTIEPLDGRNVELNKIAVLVHEKYSS